MVLNEVFIMDIETKAIQETRRRAEQDITKEKTKDQKIDEVDFTNSANLDIINSEIDKQNIAFLEEAVKIYYKTGRSESLEEVVKRINLTTKAFEILKDRNKKNNIRSFYKEMGTSK